jgi:hypothetical protein
MAGYLKLIVLDFLIKRIGVSVFERKEATNHSVEDNPAAPDIGEHPIIRKTICKLGTIDYEASLEPHSMGNHTQS